MNEFLIHVIFYVFAFIAVSSALMVISQNNPVRCVLFLVLTFFASAGLWLLSNAEFLALILILVYVGAVMTLFLFVVMMLNIDVEGMKNHYLRYIPFGLIFVAFLTGLLMVAAPEHSFNATETDTQVSSQSSELATTDNDILASKQVISNTEALGLVLYTDYLLAFELAAVLLLVAIVSAITLVHRAALRSRRQDVTKQIMTRSEDRFELINMKSEK